MKLQNFSYKILFSILFFVLAGIVFLLKINGEVTKVSASWWNSGWYYRKGITITNTSGSDKTNALVKVFDNYDLSSLVSASKLQSDLDDLRFTDSNDNLISYWTQDNTSNSADVWVIIPSLPSSGATIWMYYGNSSATSDSTSFYNYTGTSEFIDDSSGNFRIKFKSSGSFTSFASILIDAFLVGGGGGGRGGGSGTTSNSGGGGGGGYTTTASDIGLTMNTAYSIVVGSGGAGGYGYNGGASSAFSYVAGGGTTRSATAKYTGGNGGSGGGGGAQGYSAVGAGGSNGSIGYSGNFAGGSGQGTTTREFGEITGTLYAGGGGAGGGPYSTSNPGAAGGAGGGGTGGLNRNNPGTGGSGTANTGGGGGGGGAYDGVADRQNGGTGGSGIVVIRLVPISTISVSSNEEIYVYTPSNCRISESTNDSQLTVLWEDTNTNEDNYLIQKSTNEGTWTDLYYAAQNSTSYADTSISSNNSYQYRISPYVTDSTNYVWCYTPTLNLGRGDFNFEGLDLEGINID